MKKILEFIKDDLPRAIVLGMVVLLLLVWGIVGLFSSKQMIPDMKSASYSRLDVDNSGKSRRESFLSEDEKERMRIQQEMENRSKKRNVMNAMSIDDFAQKRRAAAEKEEETNRLKEEERQRIEEEKKVIFQKRLEKQSRSVKKSEPIRSSRPATKSNPKKSTKASPVKREVPDQEIVTGFQIMQGMTTNEMTDESGGSKDIEGVKVKNNLQQYIPVFAFGDQTVEEGQGITLRVGENFRYENLNIPKNAFAFGVGSFSGSRFMISVHTIEYNNNKYQVKLDAYDARYQKGLYHKSKTNEGNQLTAERTTNNTLNTLDRTGLLSAGKDLLKNNVRNEKITLKDGTKLFIK